MKETFAKIFKNTYFGEKKNSLIESNVPNAAMKEQFYILCAQCCNEGAILYTVPNAAMKEQFYMNVHNISTPTKAF